MSRILNYRLTLEIAGPRFMQRESDWSNFRLLLQTGPDGTPTANKRKMAARVGRLPNHPLGRSRV